MLPWFSFYSGSRLFKLPDLICHRLKSSGSRVPQDTSHLPCTAEGQRTSCTTSQAGGGWVPPVPPAFFAAPLVSVGCPCHLNPMHQLSGTYSSISSKTQLTQAPSLWLHCPTPNQVAQPHLAVPCSSMNPRETFNPYKTSNPSHKTQEKMKYYGGFSLLPSVAKVLRLS